jgi:hypothetical protein
MVKAIANIFTTSVDPDVVENYTFRKYFNIELYIRYV